MSAQDPEVGQVVTVAGVVTNYHDVGDGDPVVLLHGSGPGVSAWANWRGVLPELAQRSRVVAPDLLGFGRSTAVGEPRYTAAAWVAQVVALADELGLERFAVVGNSFGGSIALRLALEHPDRVSRLVLMGSVGVPFTITEGLEAVWGFTPSLEAMEHLLDVFTHDTSRLAPDLAALRLAAATRPGAHEAYSAMFPAPRQRSLDAMSLDEGLIATLAQPTLVIHGREDRVIPPAGSLRLAQLVRRSQLHVFGECGHWVQIEQHDRFVRLVADFLAEEGAPA